MVSGRRGGFSLIELILVLLIVGILGVAAAARWRGDALALDAGAGQLAQDIRYTQARAMARDETHTITRTAGNRYEIRDAGGNPVAAQPNPVELEGVSLSLFTIAFDDRGSPGTAAVDIELTRGADAITLRVTARTGAVRRL